MNMNPLKIDPYKLDPRTAAKLNGYIKNAEHGEKIRTITAEEIAQVLRQYTEKLDIDPEAMEGINVKIDINAEDFPIIGVLPKSTHFAASYHGGNWYINSIDRHATRIRKNQVIATFPLKTKYAITNKYETCHILDR